MIRFTLALVLVVCLPILASARVIGTSGATYPFAERDALTEVESKAQGINWRETFSREKAHASSFRPDGVPHVARAEAGAVRNVDMAYTLDEDIPDPRTPGRALYPKGFRFNPLDYTSLPGAVVFLDAGDREQIAWFLASQYVRDDAATIVLTGGEARTIEKAAGRPVYFASAALIEMFDVRFVPCAARQYDRLLIVEEFHVQKTRSRR